jgi:hypothetical protein
MVGKVSKTTERVNRNETLNLTVLSTGRDEALKSLERNLHMMNQSLTQKQNFKRFFWTPDFNMCGFAT